MNDQVRIRLLNYLNETGVKQTFVCDKIELSTPTFTRFKQGRTDLYNENLVKLDVFLTKQGY